MRWMPYRVRKLQGKSYLILFSFVPYWIIPLFLSPMPGAMAYLIIKYFFNLLYMSSSPRV